jgi:NADH:ubiquinone oxidoreductase subunit H
MRQATPVSKAATRALPPTIFAGAGFLAFGCFDVLRRGTSPIVMAVICLGLTAVVFLTYFMLGIAGYRVSADGTVRAPWPYAWAVALAAVLVAGAVGYLTLRSQPEPWR